MADAYIVTFYGTDNYGSNLQAYALMRTLEKRGFDVSMLKEFEVLDVVLRHPALLLARLYNRLNRGRSRRFFVPSPYEISAERKSRLEDFANDTFKEISFIDGGEWRAAISRPCVFVAGSDIIWQPSRGYPTKYFLDFAVACKCPCFSYASSLGARDLPRLYFGAYRRYLGFFLGVGVRESNAAALLESIVGRPVTKVVDPTLLLTDSEWDFFALRAKRYEDIDYGNYILCYFVMDDPAYWAYVAEVNAATDSQVVVLPMHHSHEEVPYTVITDGTPYEFVQLIKEAKLVVTDSFHACCFSLQYETAFRLLRRKRKDEDDKFDEFLDRYSFRNKVASADAKYFAEPGCDFSVARERLEMDRRKSFLFIDEILAGIRE